LCGHLQHASPVRGDVDRNRMLDVDESAVEVQEPNRPGEAVLRVLDLVAPEQPPHDAEVLAESADGHRIHAHHAHRGVPGTDTEEDAPWGETVDGRDRV